MNEPANANGAGGAPQAEETRPARPPRPAQPIFCATVLTCEAFVVGFAGLVAYGLRLAEPSTIAWITGIGAALCLLGAGLVRRGTVGLVLGSLVQVLMLASALVVPMMAIVAVVFAAIWAIAVLLGARIDREREERAAATRVES